jgi:hypothetical protein
MLQNAKVLYHVQFYFSVSGLKIIGHGNPDSNLESHCTFRRQPYKKKSPCMFNEISNMAILVLILRWKQNLVNFYWWRKDYVTDYDVLDTAEEKPGALIFPLWFPYFYPSFNRSVHSSATMKSIVNANIPGLSTLNNPSARQMNCGHKYYCTAIIVQCLSISHSRLLDCV